MKLLITGICGFVGSSLALYLKDHLSDASIIGIDNLARAGSEWNRRRLAQRGINYIHGDLRNASDLASLSGADWVVDCAAMPSVLGGVSGTSTSRQLVEHNLSGTLNLLEYCKQHNAGLILLSSSRVYSIRELSQIPLAQADDAFRLDASRPFPSNVNAEGLNESFSTLPPISLYGSTKLASEILAIEYASAFHFPLRINRCGLLAGATQFARADQGIFSYWIHSYARKKALRYIGFQGSGKQVRDIMHPNDLAELMMKQLQSGDDSSKPLIVNVSGGLESARSLKQVSQWCNDRYGVMDIAVEANERPFDVPWIVLDSTLARNVWQWRPKIAAEAIFEEIAEHADSHPDWLEITNKN